jgi:serine protease Do
LPKGESSKLKVGELVMAVGSPFSLSQSVTTGIISALERNELRINSERDAYESYIQTDAPINRGNSGGPLVNMNGEVIGMNTAIFSGSAGNDGIGFAIPIKMATSVADMLIKDGKVHYARIGIELAPLTPDMARHLGYDGATKGVLVGSVLQGSPAEKAGLKSGDVITSFAGEKVQDQSSFRIKVATSEVARPYAIDYLRDGKAMSTTIVPAPAENVVFDIEREGRSSERQSGPSEPAKTSISSFGLEVQPLTSDLARQLGLPAKQKGVVISSVKDGSPADAAGLEEGDVITRVVRDKNIHDLTSVKEFQDLASKSDELAIYVRSGKGGGGGFVTLSKNAK